VGGRLRRGGLLRLSFLLDLGRRLAFLFLLQTTGIEFKVVIIPTALCDVAKVEVICIS
jgi:hypothetical protein